MQTINNVPKGNIITEEQEENGNMKNVLKHSRLSPVIYNRQGKRRIKADGNMPTRVLTKRGVKTNAK